MCAAAASRRQTCAQGKPAGLPTRPHPPRLAAHISRTLLPPPALSPRARCPLSHPGLLVFADWYHLESIKKLRFYDDNSRSWWEAATGGLGGKC